MLRKISLQFVAMCDDRLGSQKFVICDQKLIETHTHEYLPQFSDIIFIKELEKFEKFLDKLYSFRNPDFVTDPSFLILKLTLISAL